jgi:putative hemolysin
MMELQITHPARRSAPVGSPTAPARIHTRWARDEADLRAAQRLRHQVFVQELGARTAPPAGTLAGHDADLFDAFCEHLLVLADEQVIGTYRVLTPDAARRAGGLYTEREFDLTRLRPWRARMMEAGRACVHADWRHGGPILALWAALGDFMQRNGLDSMVGCASVGMRDGGHQAADLWRQLAATHLAPIAQQVRPRLPLPVDDLATGRPVVVPPLIKGYLRSGAKLLGPPAWDPDFGTADLPLMLRLADLPARHRRHFLQA